jgi:beta-lactamase class A
MPTKPPPQPSTRLALVSVGLVAIGAAIGWMLSQWTHQPLPTSTTDVTAIYPADNTFHFTNPLLGFEITDQKELDEYKPLENTINQKISDINKDGQQNLISVYVRDLNTGQWTGVNEDQTFTPASLMKVPVMLAYLKQAQTNPSFLSTTFTITSDDLDTSPQDIPPQQGAKLGQKYTISDLLKYMIVYHDRLFR